MPYIYLAEIWCDDCGDRIGEELEAQGITDNGDSDEFPQSFAEEPTDSPQHCASREHCLAPIDLTEYGLAENAELFGAESRLIGALCGEELTEEGRDYVREQISRDGETLTYGSGISTGAVHTFQPTEFQRALYRLWSETFDIAPAVIGNFRLTIALGNSAMCSFEHIAEALRETADKIEDEASPGTIKDENGNTVGAWTVDREER